MQRYFKIFWIVFSSFVARELSMGLNVITRLAGSICFFFLHVLTFRLLVQKFSFSGWTTYETWILLFTFEIFTYLAFLLLLRGLTTSMRDVNHGGLDYLLAKPISLRFLAFFRGGGIQNLFCVMAAIIGLVSMVGFSLYFPIYLILIVFSVWIVHCVAVIIFSCNLWFGYTPGSDGFIFEIQEVYKYPATTYGSFPIWVKILVIPLAALTTVPALFLLGKQIPDSILIVYIIGGLFLTWASEFIWQKSLRHYSSASS